MLSIDEINTLKRNIDCKNGVIETLKETNEQMKARLKPFEDSYFNGLSTFEISELAKKSIRITTYNRELEQILYDIRKLAKQTISDVETYENTAYSPSAVVDKFTEILTLSKGVIKDDE